jgi:Domain of unknown function (DUF6438)
MKLVTLFFVGLSLIACKSNKKSDVVMQPTENQSLIILETTPCRGYCPVYKLDFGVDGTVQYEGIRFVQKIGTSSFQLTAAEQISLRKKLETANLWQYPESFPVTIADGPGATITIYNGKSEKNIRGSVERPKPIRDVQEFLAGLAKAHGYKLDSFNPDDIPDNAPKTELLVKLKPEINAGNWLRDINKVSKTNLKLVRRIGADNIWVIAFDASKFEQDDILTLLKSHEHVLEAQLNREAKERD